MQSKKQERFPCSDEHVEKKNIVDIINEKNEKEFGPICKKCDLYAIYCRRENCEYKVSLKTQNYRVCHLKK